MDVCPRGFEPHSWQDILNVPTLGLYLGLLFLRRLPGKDGEEVSGDDVVVVEVAS